MHTFFNRSRLLVGAAGLILAATGLCLTMVFTVNALAASNPGFESGTTGWAPLAGTTTAVVKTPVHGGVNALSIKRTSASGITTVSDNPDMFSGLAAGTVCTASAWVQGPSGKIANVKLRAMNGATQVSAVTKSVTLNGTWQQLPIATLTLPSTANTADLQFTSSSVAVGVTWYLDDVSASCNPPVSPPPPAPSGAVDRAIETGLYDGTPLATFGAYPYDYDNDGLMDVLIDPHNEPGGARLYHNNGGNRWSEVFKGTFVTRSSSGQIRKDHHGCVWGDVNQDGLPDFYCTAGANHGVLTDKANELWIQQTGGGFVNKAIEYGVDDPLGPGRGAVFVDVNHDAYPDLYLTNGSRTDGVVSPNHLYINQGGVSYKDAPEYGLNLELGSMPAAQTCPQTLDYNMDGWQDIFTCGHTGLKLYRNNQGTSYTDVTAAAGILAGAWKHAVLGDMNKDGVLDIVGLNAQGTQFRIQLGKADGTFAAATATRTLASGRQVGLGDTNGDTFLDVYIVQGGAANPDYLMINSGTGTQFKDAVIPQITAGDGQSVNPFDYNQDGIMDFIVMHGYESTQGPIELLTFPKP